MRLVDFTFPWIFAIDETGAEGQRSSGAVEILERRTIRETIVHPEAIAVLIAPPDRFIVRARILRRHAAPQRKCSWLRINLPNPSTQPFAGLPPARPSIAGARHFRWDSVNVRLTK